MFNWVSRYVSFDTSYKATEIKLEHRRALDRASGLTDPICLDFVGFARGSGCAGTAPLRTQLVQPQCDRSVRDQKLMLPTNGGNAAVTVSNSKIGLGDRGVRCDAAWHSPVARKSVTCAPCGRRFFTTTFHRRNCSEHDRPRPLIPESSGPERFGN